MDATERLLREQALEHGLVGWTPDASEVTPEDVDAAIRGEAEAEEEALHSIAGLRGSLGRREHVSSGNFVIGARWQDPAVPEAERHSEPERPAINLSSFDGPEALADSLGLEGLKVELTRRGAKAGGSLEERAARLWRIRGLARGAKLPDDLKPKPKKAQKKRPPKKEEPKEKRKLGPDAPKRPKAPKAPKYVDQSRPPLIAAAKLTKKEAAILDFCGSIPSSR